MTKLNFKKNLILKGKTEKIYKKKSDKKKLGLIDQTYCIGHEIRIT